VTSSASGQGASDRTNAVTAEHVEEINAQLKQIVILGAPATAAIRDFLQKDIDMAYGKQTAPLGAGTGARDTCRRKRDAAVSD
jgi:hypothetical protein